MASICPITNPLNPTPSPVSYGFAPTGTYRPNPYALPTGLETGKTIESILARERSVPVPVPVPVERIAMPIEPTPMMPPMPMTPRMPIEVPPMPWMPVEPIMTPYPTPLPTWSRIPTPIMTPTWSPLMTPVPMPVPTPSWMPMPTPTWSPMPWTPSPMSWTPSPMPSWTPMPWWRPEQQPLTIMPFRPANPIEMATLERPLRIVDREGHREVRLCIDLCGYKPEEITVTLNKAERAIVIEASVEAKEGKEHQVSRKYCRKVVLPEPLSKVDMTTVGPLSAVQRPDGQLIIELPVPKMTPEEMARIPTELYMTCPEAVRPVTVKNI